MAAEIRSRGPLSAWILAVTVACLTTVSAASEPAQLPALVPTAIDVDTTALPSSEKAALAHIIRAGRLMDAYTFGKCGQERPLCVFNTKLHQSNFFEKDAG